MSDVHALWADRGGYLTARAHAAAAFDLDARLPGQVFMEAAEDSLFCEFDAVLDPEFWPALSAMARWHGDTHVELVVLEPDYEGFYLPAGVGYPGASVPVDADEDEYWAAIGFEPDGDSLGSIAISANVIAVTGASGRWGCWGERDPEVAVFRCFPSAAVRDEWRRRFGPFKDVSGALASYLPITFAGRTVPDWYAEQLVAHYGPAGAPE
ncbi:hypothetical protein [Streptomyces sp. NPDC093225]|uniref:hypothetical protein n=1 Tax=Streptomyces sp. NPDC093225 TaxID=3366034 RepID=UPI00382E122C